jgi:8-oxo-dGTP pyrophosphatase MutT (NUDIX family)
MRLRLMKPDDGVSKFLEYQRSRVRVARGTVVNLALTLAAVDLFLISRTDAIAVSGGAMGLVIGNIAGLLVVAGVFVAHFGVQRAWLNRLQDAYRFFIDTGEAASGEPSGAQPDSSSIVAAAVHRLGEVELEFLIVRTADGCHWTIPKGHVREGEEPVDGVRREALEEAGVMGQVAPEPLTTYAYPPTRRGAVGDSQVTAYLLKAEHVVSAREGRSARWVTAGQAKKLLRQGRTARYASEGERVIELARQRLTKNEPEGGSPSR